MSAVPDFAPRRLYLDNAATSFPKPSGVIEAMTRYATEIGASAGRGAYAEAVESARLLHDCRKRINTLINGERAEHVIFTLNCSDALNLAIKGLIDPTPKSSHAICTHIDHNSILRPLNALAERGWCEQTRVAVDPKTGLVDPDAIRKAVRRDTKLIAITHVSNVTGTVQNIRAIGQIAREAAVPFIVDAAQSVGHLPIDVQTDCIDLLAAPGHKALLGPLGTGFLYIRPGLEKILRPLKEGGTGSVSEHDTQPDFMPDKYEPGSHNAIGIAGLSEGVRYVLEKTVAAIHAHDLDLVRTFIEGVSEIDGLTYYGPQGVRDRIGVFSVRIDGLDPHELSAILETHYGILTRSGIHCAPLAHTAIGTVATGGTTRFSFGPFLSKQDVRFATDALAEVAMTGVSR
ncbi:MAG TPA: aminotransferase class V-fold PLP-dependent enzyme [Tepidisphaeraceae bacterium]|jgi:cysteine desulfurase family protein|nr:aminotransferase class V-fold PLP-dependent enzyme [Tepidisphaeraceae bacterium]